MTTQLKIKQFSERFKRLFTYARRNISRDKMSFMTTGLVLVLMIFVCNIILSLHHISNNVLAYAHEKADFYVEIRDDADSFYIQSLLADLKNLDGVSALNYISKDEALLKFHKTFPDSGLMSFLNRYSEPNPLPASIGIVTDNLEYQASIIAFLKDNKYQNVVNQESVAFHSEQSERNEKIIQFTTFIRRIGIILIAVFLSVAFLIVFNTISANLRHRAQEIEIMYLVGAKHSSIRLPFVLEAMIVSMLAVLAANLLLLGFLSGIYDRGLILFQNQELNHIIFSSIRDISSHFMLLVVLELLIILAFAVLISYVAIHRYFQRVYAT